MSVVYLPSQGRPLLRGGHACHACHAEDEEDEEQESYILDDSVCPSNRLRNLWFPPKQGEE
jgi:hypothetical protein